MRILLVDDDSSTLEALKTMLTNRGHNVTTAVNGIEGLSIFRKTDTPFDAVVSDYQMPRSNGVIMLREMFRLAPTTRLILMSGDPPRQSDLPDGARMLRKPFNREDLLDALGL
jgi:two-component system, cell cycle sensor histidine kinase and response regulator CckA